ncbi:MAG TPA: sulfurtransferase-like selenium metabolism protein YedF [Firmicutes bacterium]|nr:sulfurtransferase-like selenium metabolism protein YedF [Bacillota bacterium]
MTGETTYLITAKTIGRGNDELGAILMRSLIKNLVSAEAAPHAVVLMNGGVQLACEGSELLEDLSRLAARGTAVLSCGTCLDFFHLKDKLATGEVGGMAQFVELFAAHHVVTIG